MKLSAMIHTGTPTVETVTIYEGPAVGNICIVVVDDPPVMPIEVPVVPSPAVPAKKAQPEPYAKSDPWSREVESWICVPPGPNSQRRAIYKPWIVLRHVDNFGIGRFNHNRLTLFCHGLLRSAVQIPRALSAGSHDLDSIHDVVWLVHIGVSE